MHQFMLQRDSINHKAHLRTWVSQVERACDVYQAATIATRKPLASQFARLVPDTRTHGARATQNVEKTLLDKVAQTTDVAVLKRSLFPLRGHFPQVYRAVETRLRALQKVSQ